MADEFDIIVHDVDEIDIDASIIDEIEITLSDVDDIEIMVFDYPPEIDLLNQRVAICEQKSQDAIDTALAANTAVLESIETIEDHARRLQTIETKMIADVIVSEEVSAIDIEGLNIGEGETVAVQIYSERFVIDPNTSAYMYILINAIHDWIYSNAATSGGLPNYPYFRVTLRERTSLQLFFTMLNGRVLMSGEGMSIGGATAYPYVISGITGGQKVLNAGGAGQTDWTDSDSDGLADSWSSSNSSYAQIFSIVTGNGFTDRAQRVQANNVLGLMGIRQTTMALPIGSTVRIKGKYRCSSPLKLCNWGLDSFLTLPINTGDALPFEVEYVPTATYFHFFPEYQVGGWFEVDDVEVTLVASDIESISSINLSSSGIGSFKKGDNIRVVKL